MKQLLATRWFVHGESGVPLWLLVPVLCAGLYLILRWLREERRQSGWASRCLPFTGALLVTLIVWLIWQPTWVRVDEWAMPSDTVVWVDASASMDMPLSRGPLSDQLDVLGLLASDAVSGRDRAPGRLADLLEREARSGHQVRVALAAAADELDQGVPAGAGATAALTNSGSWISEVQDAVFLDTETVQATVRSCRSENGESVPEDVDTRLAELTEAASRFRGGQGEEQADQLARRALDVDAFLAVAHAIVPVLRTVQQVADAQYLGAAPDALRQALEETANTTRHDVAVDLLASLPESLRTGLATPDQGDRDQTDVYGAVARLLDAREGRVVSDMVLLSDGGQNAESRPAVAQRLGKSGIRTTVIGVGVAEREQDFGVLDWHVQSVFREKKPAAVQVDLKSPAGVSLPVSLVLSVDGEPVQTSEFTTRGDAVERVEVSFEAPAEGRHVLSLEIVGEDANPLNDRVVFSVDTVKSAPDILFVGHEPNWDTAYLYLAALRAGMDARQVYHGLGDKPPDRGGSRSSIPRTLSQWARQEVVVLHGRALRGFAEEDAATLREYVTEGGGSLVIVVDGVDSHVPRLSAAFGWVGECREVADRHLSVPESVRHLPVLRLAPDGAGSARALSSLVPCERAWCVPDQDVVLLRNAAGDTVLSLGFHGKGKVYLCGLNGLYRMAEYARARTVDRLLSQLLSDAARPLYVSDNETFACYPDLPARGRSCFVVSPLADPGVAELTVGGVVVKLELGAANRLGSFTPQAAGEVAAVAGTSRAITVIDNPGLEQIYHEFGEDFLQALAGDVGGRYVSLDRAGALLAELEPGTWRSSTAARYPLADHWGLLAALAVVGTLHWTLRKLSGLAI